MAQNQSISDNEKTRKSELEELQQLKNKLGIEEPFEFNLLPGKTLEELREKVKKGNQNFFAILTPMGLVALTFILFLVNQVVLAQNLSSWENTVSSLKQELANPDNELGALKVRNGELFTKTEFISDEVAANVDFNVIFDVTETAFAVVRTAEPTSYGRENSGRFFVNGVSSNENDPSAILNGYEQQDGVEDVYLDRVNFNQQNNNYQFTISFVITTIEASPQENISVQNEQ
ncbi:MAG: hypothetical protein ACOCXP_00670 [Candidatus Dojkabacteria bacterium]